MLTAAQCASYDESKKLWKYLTGGGENLATHLGASMITGVITTTATGPVDVIKTNMFVGAPSLVAHTAQRPEGGPRGSTLQSCSAALDSCVSLGAQQPSWG